MNRLEANIEILIKLLKLVKKHPDLRFGQILVNADIIKLVPSDNKLLAEDPFYEEPEVILNRMSKNKFVNYEKYN